MDDLAIDRSAPVERIRLDDTSWVDVVRGFVREPDALLADLLDRLPWAENRMFRYEVHKTDPRLSAHFPRGDEPAVARQTKLHLDAAYRVRFAGPDLLRYRHGRDSVGFHRDRSMRYLDDTLIAIVVLGEPRPFVLRPYAGKRDDDRSDVDVAPGRGDLVVMGGRNQADWMHAVPKVAHATERVSMTWRWTSRTGPPDESENYGAARRFGDSGRVGPQGRRR